MSQVKLGDPIPLSLALQDGVTGLFPQAHVYDESDVEVGGSPFDLAEVGVTGRYTYRAFVPTSTETFVALFITYTDAPHTIESATHGRVQEMYPVELVQLAASGASINTPANASSTITTGSVVSGTYESTVELDGVYWRIASAGGVIDMYLEFAISADGSPVAATMTGRVNGNNDSLDVYAWNWTSSAWEQVGVLPGQGSNSDLPHTFNLFATHVGLGDDLGKVRLRFAGTGLTGATLRIDQAFLSYAVINRSVGYEGGAIWIDTVDGTPGTVPFINGTADNPVDSMADATTLATATKLHRFHMAPGSFITLAQAYDNHVFLGAHWDLALGGQSISDSVFIGANVTGVAVASGETHFMSCEMDTCTLPRAHLHDCALMAVITLSDTGAYLFDKCYSDVAGTDAPTIDFGAAVGTTQLSMRHYSGGIEIENMGRVGVDVMSLEGHGQLIVNANCVSGVIASRGHFDRTDNTGGAMTFSDDARFAMSDLVDAIYEESRVDHTTADTFGEAQALTLHHGFIWVNANSGTPGTVKGKNGTCINPVKTIADAIILSGLTGIRAFVFITGSFVLPSSLTEWYVELRDESELDLNGQNVNGSEFHGGVIKGAATGSVLLRDAVMEDISGLRVNAHFCNLMGTISLGAGRSSFDFCHSNTPGTSTPTINFVGAGRSMNFRAYSGGITIENMVDVTNVTTLEFIAGQLIIDSSCTGGTLVYRGDVYPVADGSAGTTVVDNKTATAVWEEPAKNRVALGTMGRAALTQLYDIDGGGPSISISASASNTNTVLGTDGTWSNPVSSDAAAKTLALALKTHRIHVRGPVTLTVAWDYDTDAYVFQGMGRAAVSWITINSQGLLAATFNDVNLIAPTKTGGDTFDANRCFITADAVDLECAGTFTDCVIQGTLKSRGGGQFLRLINCTVWASEPLVGAAINMAAATSQVFLQNITNKWTITGAGAADSTIEASSGEGGLLVLDVSCVLGTAYLAGDMEVIDNSAGMTVDPSRLNTVRVAGAVADEPVADHITVGTMGRAAMLKLYDGNDGKGPAVYYDGKVSNSGTVLGDDGTLDNPVSSEASMRTIGDALGIKRCVVGYILALPQTLTLSQAYYAWTFDGSYANGSWMDTNGHDVTACEFRNLSFVEFNAQVGFPVFRVCALSDQTGMHGTYFDCILHGRFVMKATGFAQFLGATQWNPEDISWPEFNMSGDSTMRVSDYSGVIEFQNLTSGVVELSSSLGAKVILTATCTGGAVTLAGSVELDDQSGPGCTVDLSRVTVDGLKKTAAAILGNVV